MTLVSRWCVRAAAWAALSFVAVPAFADVFLSPFAGVTFIDDSHRKTTWGAGLGVGGFVGVEFEAARTELGSFTNIPAVEFSAHVTTLMGNLMLRVPDGPVQPYVSGGGGLVRVTGSVNVPFLGSLASVSASDTGWNIGAGLMLFPAESAGIRLDVRRFQTGDLAWDELTDIQGLDDLPLPKVNFWRATGGLTFMF
jgi:opacity protein-like surface antigen